MIDWGSRQEMALACWLGWLTSAYLKDNLRSQPFFDWFKSSMRLDGSVSVDRLSGSGEQNVVTGSNPHPSGSPRTCIHSSVHPEQDMDQQWEEEEEEEEAEKKERNKNRKWINRKWLKQPEWTIQSTSDSKIPFHFPPASAGFRIQFNESIQ